jgi:methyl-accepting chemotaxis protein
MDNTRKKKTKQKGEVKGKISVKIVASIIVTNLIALLAVGTLVGFIVDKSVGEQSLNYAMSEVNTSIGILDEEFKAIEATVNTIGMVVSDEIDLAEAKSGDKYLEEYASHMEGILYNVAKDAGISPSVYIYFNYDYFGQYMDCWVYEDGEGDFARQDILGKDYYDEYEAEWYHKPIDDGEAGWTDPYYNVSGRMTSNYVIPIKKDGITIALVGMDIFLDDMAEDINEITLFETGYVYMMTPEGDLAIHKAFPWKDTDGDGVGDTPENMIDLGYPELVDEISKNDYGYLTYKLNGKEIIAGYGHLDNGWVIGSSTPASEVTAVVGTIIRFVVGIAIVVIIIAAGFALFVGRSITKPIKAVVDAADKMKEGDFTVRVETNANDETKILANSINEMADSVKSLISKTKDVSGDMVESASNLAAMAEETNATVEQVAVTVNEISKGSQDTATESENGAVAVQVMDDKFAVLRENSDSMRTNADLAIETNKQGLEVLEDLRVKSETSKVSNEKVSVAVEKLDQRAAAITEIIATITSIASQTYLLALNASMEAARAGEAGKGFAVVAEEIRKLAEDSSAAADDISDIVRRIQTDSKETVAVMTEVNHISEEQNEAVAAVNDSFDKIFKAVQSITDGIESVSDAVNDLEDTKDDIISVTNNISAVSEETAASTQEVNASMTEQTRAVESVAENAELLNGLAVELNNNINVFKID